MLRRAQVISRKAQHPASGAMRGEADGGSGRRMKLWRRNGVEIRLSRRGGRWGMGGIETRQLDSSPPCRTLSWRVIAMRKEATRARCVGGFERSASHAGCRRVDSGATSLCAPPNPAMHRDRHPVVAQDPNGMHARTCTRSIWKHLWRPGNQLASWAGRVHPMPTSLRPATQHFPL